MKILSVLAAVAILSSTSYALEDCATIWNDASQRTNTSGAIRLTMLHTQHRCSPVRRQTDPPPSWRHSLALDRERQLQARLLFRRRPAPRNLSTAVVAGGMHGFMAQVAIGTPPRTQAVLIDTAAPFSWVQCDPCVPNGCYNQDGPLFDTRASSTYTKVPCSTQLCQSVAAVVRTSCSTEDKTCLYRVPYMDWSASEGSVSRDTLTVGEEKIPGFVFGCSRHYERMFGRYAGIFGFANDGVSFFSQVVEKCRQYRAFSYYLPSPRPSSVGYIQVGSYDEGGLAFTPMFIHDQDYFLALTGITVDGVQLDLASTNDLSGQPQPGPSVSVMFLDLGSPLSILPSKVYGRLCDAVAKGIKGYDRIQSGHGCCFDPSFLATERAVPTVHMHFRNGVRLVLNEARLTYETPDERLCLAFQAGTRFLLGSMQLLMTYVVQDVEKSIMGFPKT